MLINVFFSSLTEGQGHPTSNLEFSNLSRRNKILNISLNRFSQLLRESSEESEECVEISTPH